MKQGNRLVRTDAALVNRDILLCQLPHPAFHFADELLIKRHIAVNRAVIPLAHREMNPYFLYLFTGIHIINRLHKQKAHASLIRLMPDGSGSSLKIKRTIRLYLFPKLLQFSVYIRKNNIIIISVPELLSNLLIRCSGYVLPLFISNLHAAHLFFFHNPTSRLSPVYTM